MGGFARYRGDHLVCVLNNYHSNYNPREKEFISGIPEREIKDRSHTDGFAKLIAVWQTTWFVVQLLARLAQRLPITELETMTAAFAAMNVLLYFFWWNKPLGVTCHIRIQDESVATSESCTEEITSPYPTIQREQMQQTVISIVKNVPKYLCKSWEILTKNCYNIEWNTIRITAIVLISPFWFPIYLFRSLILIKDADTTNKIPSFFRTQALEPEKLQDHYIAYGAAMLFGAIHCAAWTVAFPSAVEQVWWRIASVIVTCAPLYMIFVAPIISVPQVVKLFRGKNTLYHQPLLYLGVIISITYILARISLIVLPFLALRDLPPGAFETIEWITFVPHI
ncbi:hypothetical protein GYMLUDRAFT_225169 [Collybiopsis luxurians FD-317 M1]|uniref:Uncharacterized protein n=1 Tax=Collybiopsis luxurians FD-317 M1 TaxID=944289 RepID=A0A0D0BZY9_9AGAR|nr:hypothetical protein GYMLUDRAFT_225169 [Collybiopsis luxurians FD-317 M1]